MADHYRDRKRRWDVHSPFNPPRAGQQIENEAVFFTINSRLRLLNNYSTTLFSFRSAKEVCAVAVPAFTSTFFLLSLPVTPTGVNGSNEASPPLPVTGQSLDGAPAVVHVLHFRFHGSPPGCLRSTTLPLTLWSPAETFTFTYPFTAGIVGAPQMTSLPVSSVFPCSPQPSGTWRTPGLPLHFLKWSDYSK